MAPTEDEDARIRRDIELIVSGRMLADAGDKKEIEDYIQRLEQRRDALMDSGPWRIFRGSELADIQYQLGRASVGYEVVREQDASLISKQGRDQTQRLPEERSKLAGETRKGEWWDSPTPPSAAISEGRVPDRSGEPERGSPPQRMTTTQREVAQSKLLERDKPREWWDDGTSPDPTEGHDPEPERGRR